MRRKKAGAGWKRRIFLLTVLWVFGSCRLARAASSPAAARALNRFVNKRLEQMSIEEKAAQLFVVTPEALTGVDMATQAGEITREAFNRCPVGGLIFFEQNIQSAQQIKQMLAGVSKFSEERMNLPLFTCVDEEGGSVARLSGRGLEGIPRIPSMSVLALEGEETVQQAGRTIGTYLNELGFNVDLAPVADVPVNPENTVIASRAFSSDPAEAARMTKAFVRGLTAAGVLATLKHFPGHGNTSQDSHTQSAVSDAEWEQLRERDLLPFAAGIEEGAQLVMAGHISLPEVTGESTPASLSHEILTGLLRKEMGYTGLIITDALNMAAVTQIASPSGAAVKAFLAGADLLLMPADFREAYEGILSAVRSGEISQERLDASVKRILRVKLGMQTGK